jgi:hypothetical protein
MNAAPGNCQERTEERYGLAPSMKPRATTRHFWRIPGWDTITVWENSDLTAPLACASPIPGEG